MEDKKIKTIRLNSNIAGDTLSVGGVYQSVGQDGDFVYVVDSLGNSVMIPRHCYEVIEYRDGTRPENPEPEVKMERVNSKLATPTAFLKQNQIEKGQILICKQDYDNGSFGRLTQGKSYEFIEFGMTKNIVAVVDDSGRRNSFSIEYFDIPTPSIEFKKGDRVYWNELEGQITELDIEDTADVVPLEVTFSNGTIHYFTADGKLSDFLPRVLTFKPQQLDYSRPQWQPKEGEWCWFWDEGDITSTLSQYKKGQLGNSIDSVGTGWNFCAPFIGELPPHLKGGSK